MLLLGGAMLSLASPVLAADRPTSFDYAATKLGKWDLTATTQVHWPDNGSPPTASRVDCRGDNEQIRFGMDEAGGLSIFIDFRGTSGNGEDRDLLTLLGDHLWLYIDGERWEFAHIAKRSGAFSNLEYPPPESDIIMPVFRGHQAVRKSDKDPWLNFSSLYPKLLAARKVEWSFKLRNWKDVDGSIPANQLPKDWTKTRYPVDQAGLADAVTWCARQISSDAAYILPANLKEAVKP